MEEWIGGKGLRARENESHEIGCLQKVVDSRKYPCGVCGKGVDANSIKCTLCMKWPTSCKR